MFRICLESKSSGHRAYTTFPILSYFTEDCKFVVLQTASHMKGKDIAIQVLEDSRDFLARVPADVYGMTQDILSQASIGQHTRHFIEFYQCLLEQIVETDPLIDYAARKRDHRLELDPGFASAAVSSLVEQLRSLEADIPCRLECSEHMDDNRHYSVPSSLERELIYNIEHTIHHLAIIKIGIRTLSPGFELPGHFGVAPSTIRYKSESCAQ